MTPPNPEDRAWLLWQDAIAQQRWEAAAEYRLMFLALTPGRAVPQVPLMTWTNCAACTGTLTEIARLTDLLRAHQAGVPHPGAPERI